MPQLDRIILFPQIFWLFIVFVSFYIVLTHFFLPRFLKILKSRKSIIDLNDSKIIKIRDQFIKSEQQLNQILVNDLLVIRKIFNSNPTFEVFYLKNSETKKVDETLSKALKNSVLFCNFQILDLIEIRCKLANNVKLDN
uniref:ATP synthase F0 subunit 8 n=1 Tax=Pterocladia robusta TaxID=1911547 RepID=A0A1D8X7V6_9FLOR|nr:ATP synthase F0 subunit 8 [Pterocladia robusta]AOX49117.1 ATP synthase F0 subunit 8 [Pterocladia robusta]